MEGEEDSVTSAVATLLGCPVSKGKGKGGEVLAGLQVEEAVGLMEDRSGSHLLEVGWDGMGWDGMGLDGLG